MMLLDKWQENETRIREAGRIALGLAKDAGVPAYYRDPVLGAGLVKELPDGRRLLVEIRDGQEHVTGHFQPRG
ncbi:hypothetical protein GCM10011390_28140 [Aureimonas endophytica]|uniref:Uncharacterized protein n=1 Tax=Aureimonas endophytica TaxID=2027858 RepID=A0A916ZR66_9HYPH|nr:hypothetical protein [Aureimonas endophytica]GGE07452.1 hypothetical protein GCM10011390_28140 [Aureimonas endophytica]